MGPIESLTLKSNIMSNIISQHVCVAPSLARVTRVVWGVLCVENEIENIKPEIDPNLILNGLEIS